MKSLSLNELTTQIRQVITLQFDSPVWVRAEINELRENNGHCFMELIEKDESTDNIIAKIKANCWASIYRILKPYFESITGQPFRAGIKVLIAVSIEFSELYGISLNVRDIDPVFTVGELATRRQQIIRQLDSEGIADMNKQLQLPTLPQKLAVITSESAAGYGDFKNQLANNNRQFVFYTKLFPAIMQGAQAEKSIILALDKIYNYVDIFDVVVIIRGGGATTDLSCFDSYNLAANCTQFPLPVISGIGHQRDTTILDYVAHTSVKTPTAAAEFLIDKLQENEDILNEISSGITEAVTQQISFEEGRIELTKLKIKQTVQTCYLHEINKLNIRLSTLKNYLKLQSNKETSRLKLLENKIITHSPQFLTEKGYSITTVNGKRITSKNDVAEGDLIRTYLGDGYFESIVQEK